MKLNHHALLIIREEKLGLFSGRRREETGSEVRRVVAGGVGGPTWGQSGLA